MKKIARLGLMVGALSLALSLAACDSFDPTELLDFDFLNTKKKLQGDRQPVFPDGTPGVPQGVPPELIKGHQATEPDPATTQAVAPPAEEKPKPKAKPKPKVVTKPPEQQPSPAAVTVRPTMQAAPAQQPAPAAQQSATAGAWPSSQSSPGGGVAWPDPPPTR